MVPAAVIVIELSPPDAPPVMAQAMVDACNHGPEAGIQCALAPDATSSLPSRVAVVTWRSPERLSVDVQVGLQTDQGNVWSTRHLDFTENDQELERWRAVGLVVATLAKPTEAPPPPEPTKPAVPVAPPPPTDVPRPLPSPTLLAKPWLVEVAGTLAHAHDGLDVRGASLRSSRRVATPIWYVGINARYETAQLAPAITLDWLWLGAGPSVSFPVAGGHLSLDARVEPTLGWVRGKLGEGAERRAESGWLWGVREGAGAAWWLSEWMALTVSVEATQLNRATETRISNEAGEAEQRARVGALTWGTTLGLRFGFGEAGAR